MAGAGEVRRGHGARGTTAHDDDVGVAAHASTGSVVGVRRPVAARARASGPRRSRPDARRTRRPRRPAAAPAPASSARSSIRVYARWTDSGPSWRVNRLRVISGSRSRAPIQWWRARTRSLTTTPRRATRAASRRNASASRRLEVMDDERGVDDVERAVRPRQAPAVGHDELEARRAVEPRVDGPRRLEHLGPRVDARHPERPTGRAPRSSRASGMSARRCRRRAACAAPCGRRAAGPARAATRTCRRASG